MAYGDKTCSVEGCDKPMRARGCCDHHYHRLTVYGSVTAATASELKAPWLLPEDGIIDEIAVERVMSGWGEGTRLTSREMDEVILRMGDAISVPALAEMLGITESLINARIFKLQRYVPTDNYETRCGCAGYSGAAYGCCLARNLAVRPVDVCGSCFTEHQQGHPVEHAGCKEALPSAVEPLAESA